MDKRLSAAAIDQAVIAQAEDGSAWEAPMHVQPTAPVALTGAGRMRNIKHI